MEQRFYFQQGLRNDATRFVNEKIPITLQEDIDLICQYENAHFFNPNNDSRMRDWTKSATCHWCKDVRHIAPDCPHKYRTSFMKRDRVTDAMLHLFSLSPPLLYSIPFSILLVDYTTRQS